jgi:hypothetical protein
MEAHPPGLFWLCVSDERVTNRRIGALKLVVRWLLGFNSTLLESVGVAVFHETFTDNFQKAVYKFCEALRVPVPIDLTFKKCGNTVTVLLQWRCLLALVSMLEKHQEDSLKSMFELSPKEKELTLGLPKAFDSHCHLDRTRTELALSDPSLAAICVAKAQDEEFEVKVTGTAICCNPDNYPSDSLTQSWLNKVSSQYRFKKS